ncbi:hypothetical protein NX02_24355 [Sphingomonas sanxanigenens DSM 19645 = NX02]|uniref:Uncharacterized protein n=1 Tax=Sphingomonas sanxanigenens DSM 19645 = NX02 TaxID=1123269 RepID=W0AJP0_9SPHN|nr:hypothetical protein NX02_24355 [Sphingomonas sanxanigenens DSM 19645 = NX02]
MDRYAIDIVVISSINAETATFKEAAGTLTCVDKKKRHACLSRRRLYCGVDCRSYAGPDHIGAAVEMVDVAIRL